MKKILSLLLCGLLCVLPTACQGTTNGNGSVEGESVYLSVESFDSYDTLNKIWFNNSLSSASVDTQYFTEGTGSMKVEVSDPVKYLDQQHATNFYIPTIGAKGDYHDFSMIDEVSLDVYGVAGTNMNVALSIALKGKTVVSGPSKAFEIKQGEWNHIRFTVNRTVTDASIDITKISHISVECSGVNAVMCLDNLRLHKTTKDFVSAEFIVDKARGEVCDFEKAYQSFAVTAATVNGMTPKLEVITDPEWATSGARALKIISPAMDTNAYYSIEFSERLLDAAEINLASTTAYVAYDIYKPFARSWWFTTRLRCSDSGAYDNVSIVVPEGIGWHTVCVPLTRRVLNTTNMQINWQSKNGLPNGGADEVEFYIDNVRIIDTLPTKGSVYVATP